MWARVVRSLWFWYSRVHVGMSSRLRIAVVHEKLPDCRQENDIFVSSTGVFNIVTVDHMTKMKNSTIAGNIRHFHVAGLEGRKIDKTMLQVMDRSIFSDGHGAPAQTSHPGLRHQSSFLCDVVPFLGPDACAARLAVRRRTAAGPIMPNIMHGRLGLGRQLWW